MATTTKRQKIGKGYYQKSYGRGFKKNPIIWLINGKAYAKESNASPFQTDLEGYVMLNFDDTYNCFYQIYLICDHKQFKETIQFSLIQNYFK